MYYGCLRKLRYFEPHFAGFLERPGLPGQAFTVEQLTAAGTLQYERALSP